MAFTFPVYTHNAPPCHNCNGEQILLWAYANTGCPLLILFYLNNALDTVT